MATVPQSCLVAGLVFGLAFATAHAAVYKWVDEDGVVQYAQTPPPGVQTQEIAPPPPPSSSAAPVGRELQERLDAFNKRREERLRREQESTEEREFREKLTADCQRIRENLAVLSNSPRVVEQLDDGTRVAMTDQRRAEKTQLFQKQFDEHCGDI